MYTKLIIFLSFCYVSMTSLKFLQSTENHFFLLLKLMMSHVAFTTNFRYFTWWNAQTLARILWRCTCTFTDCPINLGLLNHRETWRILSNCFDHCSSYTNNVFFHVLLECTPVTSIHAHKQYCTSFNFKFPSCL